MTADLLPAASVSPTLAFVKPAVSEIRFGRMRFLITDRPNVFSLETFVKELQRNKVKAVVRVCEPTYPAERLERDGICVMDWQFADGAPPSLEIINKWLELVKETFEHTTVKDRKSSKDSGVFKAIREKHTPIITKASTPLGIESEERKSATKSEDIPAIAVHCVAGLGRAPILVAIALLEAGMSCEDVIFLIRTNRRGALNDKQLKFLREYRPMGRLRKLRYVSNSSSSNKERKSCALM